METMTRISVPVTVEEREALRAAAEQRMLNPRVYARYVLRRALFSKPQRSLQPIKTTSAKLATANAGGVIANQ